MPKDVYEEFMLDYYTVAQEIGVVEINNNNIGESSINCKYSLLVVCASKWPGWQNLVPKPLWNYIGLSASDLINSNRLFLYFPPIIRFRFNLKTCLVFVNIVLLVFKSNGSVNFLSVNKGALKSIFIYIFMLFFCDLRHLLLNYTIHAYGGNV